MIRTRVGYAGGEKKNPSYHSLGNHTEVISIDYDPAVLKYEEMLNLFWSAHRCDQAGYSRQYMNALFYHNDEQKKAAQASVAKAAKAQGVSLDAVKTAILPVGEFTYAEAYHQKYYLTRYSDIRGFLGRTYADGKSLADSTVATRLNAYLGSGKDKDWDVFVKELSSYGLPKEIEDGLRRAVEKIEH